jgi:hypothetical protein
MEDVVGTYYKYSISDITDELNVYEYILIWTIFLVLEYGARSRSL